MPKTAPRLQPPAKLRLRLTPSQRLPAADGEDRDRQDKKSETGGAAAAIKSKLG